MIERAADAIANVLAGIRLVNKAYPYPRPLSTTQFGDLTMEISSVSPPATSGGTSTQVLWDCFMFLRGSRAGDEAQVQKDLAELLGGDQNNSILGVLYKNDTSRAALREFGDPALDPEGEGIQVEYNVPIGGDSQATAVSFTLIADLEI